MVAVQIDSLLAQFVDPKVAVAFQDLENGDEYFLCADDRFHPASTFKVAVMLETFHQAEQGLFSLGDQVQVANSFTSIADGSTFCSYAEDDADASLYERVGDTETLREIVRLMIVRSSNLATNILIQRVGATRVTAFLHELGIQSVEVLRGPEDNQAYALGLNNSATARGLMQMLRLLAERNAVSTRASDEMIQILLRQEFNEGIPAGLPPGMKVAHKTGWNDRLYHDCGVVYVEGRRPYILAVMTSGFDTEPDAHACVAEISRLIYAGISF